MRTSFVMGIGTEYSLMNDANHAMVIRPLSVVLALFAAVVWCNNVAALPELALPAELAMVGEWVEGGGLLAFGRRRVLFVRFILCVAVALYFLV